MPRYFSGDNASRPIRAGGQEYVFQIISCAGGTHQGVLEIPDDRVEAFLAVGARWVTEITAEEYAAELKKKLNGRGQRPIPDSPPPPRLGPPLKGRGAVVVDGASIARPELTDSLPKNSHEAVTLGRAEPPPTDPYAPKIKPGKRLNHLQKRGMTKQDD